MNDSCDGEGGFDGGYVEKQSQAVGYICFEEKTGVCDGIYMKKSDARHMTGFHQALWSGSHWIVKPAFTGDTVRGRFHTEKAMLKRLEKFYGKKNYKAADRYDRL